MYMKITGTYGTPAKTFSSVYSRALTSSPDGYGGVLYI